MKFLIKVFLVAGISLSALSNLKAQVVSEKKIAEKRNKNMKSDSGHKASKAVRKSTKPVQHKPNN